MHGQKKTSKYIISCVVEKLRIFYGTLNFISESITARNHLRVYVLMYVVYEACKIRYGGWNNTSVAKRDCVLLNHAKKEDNICTRIAETELFLCTP
jgi:hypothetical protein